MAQRVHARPPMSSRRRTDTPPTGERVRDRMRRDFIALAPDEDLWAATRLMGMARVRNLPVVEGGVFRGMVSQQDLLRVAIERARGGGRAALAGSITPWIRGSTPSVDADAPLDDAAGTMLRTGLPCLVALEGGRLVGLLTESDLLRAAFERLVL